MKKEVFMLKLLFLTLFFVSISLYAKTPIFVLHSYTQDYPWTLSQETGFKSTLAKKADLYPLYSMECLDTKRRSLDTNYEEGFVRYMHNKYKDYRPELIYVTDDNALNFMIKYAEELFPAVPVIFSGVNDLSKQNTLNKNRFTGIFEKKEIIPNIRLIKKLFPKENKILLLGDGSTTSKGIINDLESDMRLESSLDIQSLNEQNFQSLMPRLKAFSGKVIVLTTIGGFKTQDGQLIPLVQVIDKILAAGDFVVMSLEDTYIRQGVIGGYVNDGINQGNYAGEAALAILTGQLSELPQTVQSANNWIFDAQALAKSNIVLPKDVIEKSRILNSPPTFFQEHQDLLVIALYALIAFVLLSSLFFAQYMYRSRRTILEREEGLADIKQGMEKAQTIAHLGNWDWNIQKNSLWWSDEIYRIFGLEAQEFKATYEGFMERVHPDDRDRVNQAVTHTLEHGTDYHIEHRIIKKDGTVRNVVEEGSLKTDAQGKPLRMIGIVHDITEAYEKEQELEASEKKYRDLVENSMVGIYRTDLLGNILYVNQTLAKILGSNSVDEVMHKGSLLIYSSQQERDAFIQQLQKKGHVSNYELTGNDLSKNPIPLMISASLDGDIITGMMIDMSEIKESRKEIDKLSKVVEQIDDTVLITDKKGLITYVNEAFCEHTGYTKEDVIGQTPSILKSGKYEDDFYKGLWKTILNGDVFKETFINKKKSGDLFYEKKTISPLRDDKNELIGFVSSGKDVTLETMMHKEIEHVASTDKLTGIHNRYKFEELFTLEAERARRFKQPLSLILIDIDHFKSVNDTYGHDVGDDVLKHLASVVELNCRKIDIFARWGGEEFLVLAPGTDLQEVYMLAEKLRLAVECAYFPKVENITISLGISTFEAEDTFSSLFKHADQALYDAKAEGRNRVKGSKQ